MTLLPPNGFLGLFACVSTSKGNHAVYCKQLKSDEILSPQMKKHLEYLATHLTVHENELQQLEGHGTKHGHFSQSFNFPKAILADLLVPSKVMCNKKYIVTLENVTFISHPIAINAASIHFINREHRSGSTPSFTISEDSNDDLQIQDTPSISLRNISKLLEIHTENHMYEEDGDKTALHHFNIALVVDNRYIDATHFDMLHEFVIEKLISIFEAEQLASHYISKQVQLLLQKTEKQTALNNDEDMHTILDNLLDHLKGGKSYSFELYQKIYTFPNIRNFSNNQSIVQPYQTILFKETRQQMEYLLQEEFNTIYLSYFNHFSPFLSLSESALINDCSLEVIIDMAQALVTMNYATVIDPISLYNFYAMSPLCDLNRVKLYSPNFKTKFGLDLFSLLSRFKKTKPLMEHVYDMANLTKDDPYSQIWMDAMLDLLKLDLVKQISVHIFLVFFNDSKSTLMYDYSELSTQELEQVDMLSNRMANPLNDYFKRICKYCNGKYSLNEIAFYSQVSFNDLQRLIEAMTGQLLLVYL